MESQSLSHILSSSNILLALTVLGLLYIVVLYVFGPKYDKREPPAIPHWLPYVGHILALFRHGAKYFEELWYVVCISYACSFNRAIFHTFGREPIHVSSCVDPPFHLSDPFSMHDIPS